MKEQVLNEIVKFDSTAEYYQQLEKSILGNQSCYEATVVDGELLGMKVLVEGKHPVGLYLPNATDERRQKAEQMILDYVADPDYFERYMSIGPTANDHFVFMEKVGSGKQMVICGAGHVSIALLRLAKMVGFKVTVIDDRPVFCNKAREAGADEVICEPFRQALERMDDHQEPYFIIVTRGHQYDVDCMHVILGKRHSYIGMMGSKVRVKNLKAGLLEEGYDCITFLGNLSQKLRNLAFMQQKLSCTKRVFVENVAFLIRRYMHMLNINLSMICMNKRFLNAALAHAERLYLCTVQNDTRLILILDKIIMIRFLVIGDQFGSFSGHYISPSAKMLSSSIKFTAFARKSTSLTMIRTCSPSLKVLPVSSPVNVYVFSSKI